MKKYILLAVFAIVAIATAQAQIKYQVIDSKITDRVANEKVNMSAAAINRIQRSYKIRMKTEDVINDTIYYKTVIDAYLNNLWNLHSKLEDYFSTPDTITIVNYNGKFYENGDTTATDLITERQQLIARYNTLVSKYGELAKYETEFRKMLKRYNQLQDWETQITGQ